jgi:hypothetical protein
VTAVVAPSADRRILGRTEPRLWTPPLRPLTLDTSYGFDVIEFARDQLGHPLDPWEQWLVIHLGELLPDGRPRFRRALVLVARQNGKTTLMVVLTLFWLFVDRVSLVLGTSTKLDYAAESWRKACRLARRVPELRAEIPAKGGVRKANGEQVLWRADAQEQELDEGSRYKIAASNEEGGRSLTIDRLVLDELRQHHDYTAYDASVPAMNAVPDAQAVAISNAGSAKSVVLNDLRESAVAYITTGIGDERLGLFEWSAPPGASPLDLDALAQANPNLGYRIDPEALLGEAHTAVARGGAKLAGFRTEVMCQTVQRTDPAVDPDAWAACAGSGDLAEMRSRVALCVDVALDEQHATLVAAAQVPGGRVRVDVVAAWSGPTCVADLRRDLPVHVARVRPRVVGWFPGGPAAVVAADMGERAAPGDRWPPRGVTVEEIKGEVAAACMGFSALVTAHGIEQPDDELLSAHVMQAEKLRSGDRWRFTRRGAGHCDGAYAAAGAVHLARTLPTPVGRQRLIVARGGDSVGSA